MANQIADFFRPYPDEEAIAGVQEHIRSFWTPSMREELAAYAAAGGKGLNPRVLAAIDGSAPAESPISKVTAGPEGGRPGGERRRMTTRPVAAEDAAAEVPPAIQRRDAASLTSPASTDVVDARRAGGDGGRPHL